MSDDHDPRVVREAEASNDARAALTLLELMYDISEDHYCAGWMMNLEFDLWGMIEGGPRAYGFGEVSLEKVEKLRAFSERCEGWWRWGEPHEGPGPVFTPIERWRRMFASAPARTNL